MVKVCCVYCCVDTDAEREKLLEEMAALKAQWDKEKDDLEKQNAALEKSIAQHNKVTIPRSVNQLLESVSLVMFMFSG